MNQHLETGLCILCNQNPATWAQNLVWVEYAHNSLPSATTGMTPFQVVFGYQQPLFPALESDATVPSASALVRRCHLAWRRARQILLRSIQAYTTTANRHRSTPPCYKPGQRVWLSTTDLPLKVECKKLAPRFIGPFPIAKVINPVAVPPPAPAWFVDGGPAYTVRRLLRSRKGGVDSNTWLIGRVMPQRNVPGYQPAMFWIPL
ncbi:hypothetical protein Q8A73_014438 [Channa argus]|nr:hypothetical protein Q8A73_014438 [Channa argus]